MATTIQVQEETRDLLERLKEYPRETFDEVIRELISLKEEDKMELSKETEKALAGAHEDVRKGRVYTTKELIKELGI